VHGVSILLGPFAIATVVLVVGGVFKLRDPAPTHEMLRALSLPPSNLVARVLGASEVVLGGAALLVGGPWLAAGVAVTFTAFAAVSLRLLRSGGATSCGCFGSRSAPPSILHVGANAVVALVALGAAMTSTTGLWVARGEIDGGLAMLALVGVGTWLTIAVMTVLPDTLDAARRAPRTPAVTPFSVRAVDGALDGALDDPADHVPSPAGSIA